MKLPEEIHTRRLSLRLPTMADAEDIYARYATDPVVCRYLSWVPHRSIEDTYDFLRRSTDPSSAERVYSYLVRDHSSGLLLGSVGGTVLGHRFGFGYCLAQDAWGQGFATEAANAYVDAMWCNAEVIRIQAYCDTENHASARVLRKIGLELEGTLRRYVVLPNLGAEPRDVFCFAAIRK